MKHLIDAHCHIYPDPIARKAVGGISHFYGDLPFDTYDGTLHRLVESGDAYGVEHNIVFSVATTPHQVHSLKIKEFNYIRIAKMNADIKLVEVVVVALYPYTTNIC